MKLAVVGAGPSGLAAARAALQKHASVYLIDANPHPGGLLRYGVGYWNAPLKNLQEKLLNDLDKLASEPGAGRLLFLPNRKLGTNEIEELSAFVDGIVLACGGELQIIEDGRNELETSVINCHDIVGMYNNAPWISSDSKLRCLHLLNQSKETALLGMGNVSLDILTYLRDRGQHGYLRAGRVHIVGRRSIKEARWTSTAANKAFKGIRLKYMGEPGIALPAYIAENLSESLPQDSTADVSIYTDANICESSTSPGIVSKEGLELGKVDLVIRCTGFATPNRDLVKTLRTHCPTAKVGWLATSCRGDVGSAITSGSRGTRSLMKVIEDLTLKNRSDAILDVLGGNWLSWTDMLANL